MPYRIISAFLLVVPVLVLAQTDSVYVDIGPCMAIANASDRYACYDALEAQIRAARAREAELPVVSLPRNTRQQPAATMPETAAMPPSTETVTDVADFGREPPAVADSRQNTARVLESADGEQELVDTISSLDERLPDQWAITLASGQVWHQINSKRYRLREGMEVRIYPSPFGGSYRLSAATLNGFIQVRRAQ